MDNIADAEAFLSGTESEETVTDIDVVETPEADATETLDQPTSLEGESDEFDPKSFLDDTDVKTPEDGGLLDLVNGLELERNGTPVKFESMDDLTAKLQQGLDYTFKTQQLSEERKQFEESFEAKEKEYQEKFEAFEEERGEYELDRTENNIMLGVLQRFKESTDPDEVEAFNMVYGAFTGDYNTFNQAAENPVVKGLQKEVETLKGHIGNQEKTAINETVKGLEQEWGEGLKGLQEGYAVKMRKHGIAPTWDKVKEVWQAANAGGSTMTPEQAFFSVHGPAIQKARDAMDKASKTKAQSKLRQGPENNSTVTLGKVNNREYYDELLEYAQAY